jgi:hypothetical protein
MVEFLYTKDYDDGTTEDKDVPASEEASDDAILRQGTGYVFLSFLDSD